MSFNHTMVQKFLDSVYDHGPTDSRELYSKWANSYDQELGENQYVTPKRTAQALAQFVSDKSLPLLDYGCGTGLSGQALKASGFDILDGYDITQQMIDVAKTKNIYHSLTCFTPENGPDIAPHSYDHIAAIGVISVGAGPISLFDDLLNILKPNGLFAFSFNQHTLDEVEYTSRIDQAIDSGQVEQLFCENGPHILGKSLNSNVYVLKKK